ncbi:MAG: Imm30 family immunity protein [Anaerolineae bacterium]
MTSSEESLALVERLAALRHFPTNETLNEFHSVVTKLRDMPPDSRLLPQLYRTFSDAEDYGVFWTLLHYIETYPFEDQLAALTPLTPELASRDMQHWLPTIYVRIVNNPETLQLLKKTFQDSDESTQHVIQQILESLYDNVQDEDVKKTLQARIETVLSSSDV